MKVYISPSNQYGNLYSGVSTNEMEQCNRIAEWAEKHLKRNGYEVKRSPKGQDMNKSIAESNSWKADLHVPIHTNAGGGRGALVMVYKKAPEIMQYAESVYNELTKISPKGGGYGVRIGSEMTGGHWMPAELASTNAISIYCECDFHDNPEIAKWIVGNPSLIGEAIAKGICIADGKEYIAENQTPEPAPEPTPAPAKEIKPGDYVKIAKGARYTTGKVVPDMILAETWIVESVKGTSVLINKSVSGGWAINSRVNAKYLTVVGEAQKEFEPYIVRVEVDALNIRLAPSTLAKVVGTIRDRGAYTIVAEADGVGAKRWGRLKSGAGWISLDYVRFVRKV